MRTLTAEIRLAAAQQTAALVRGGLTYTKASDQIAVEVGVAGRTVRAWVEKYGIDIQKQDSRISDFNERRRAESGNRLANVVEGRIAQLEKAIDAGTEVDSRQIRELTIAFGVLTDKRRLEDGLATDRHETSEVPAREIIKSEIDELDERRKQKRKREQEQD